ncbi:MAG: type I restriction endonuclease [Halioglobus sp.]|nr:type I restriction endonuclease [Halioglobus sp.]
MGYDYRHGPDIAHDGENPERSSYADVVLAERLRAAVARINPDIPLEAREQAVKMVVATHAPELLAANEMFHRLLTDAVEVEFQQDGETRGEKVWLVDFENPEANDCLVCNQFTIVEDNTNKRPDLILFINGLPLVVLELKNAAAENATIRSAYEQLQTYKNAIPACSPTTACWWFRTAWRHAWAPSAPVSAASWPGRPRRPRERPGNASADRDAC